MPSRRRGACPPLAQRAASEYARDVGIFRRNPGPSPQQFWAEVERRREERVILFSLGRYLQGVGGFPPQCWGVIYLSESAICFRTFPQSNWLSALLGGNRGAPAGSVPERRSTAGGDSGSGIGTADAEQEFCIALSTIDTVKLEGRGTILQRIFSPRFPTLRIERDDGTGSRTSVRIEIERDAVGFVDAIDKQMTSKER